MYSNQSKPKNRKKSRCKKDCLDIKCRSMVKDKFINDPRIASAALHPSVACYAHFALVEFSILMALALVSMGLEARGK